MSGADYSYDSLLFLILSRNKNAPIEVYYLSFMKYLNKIFLTMLLSISMIGAQTSINISAKATTSATGNDVDDCAFWVHPTDPSKSLVIVNDKGVETSKGGLYIYNLTGVLEQKVSIHQPQNPDIRYNVVFGSDTMDVVVCVDRGLGDTTYNKVRIFKINPDKAQATSGFLTEITTAKGIPTGQTEAYGHSLYQRPSDGALFSIVTPNSTNDFTQIKLQSDGAGKVKGAVVRKWGRTDIKGDICEGTCADDELGFIYICDENSRVMKYYADPDSNINAVVGIFALKDGIEGDREGINIYRCRDNTGYILVSSQGNDQIKVYDRITNAFLGTVIPEGMKDCDGLDVTATPLGAKFPHGMAAFHLGSTIGSQFGFYDWSDIAAGLKLATPCDARRPNGSKVMTVPGGKNMLSSDVRQWMDFTYFRNNTMLRIKSSVLKGFAEITLHDLQGRLIETLYKGFMPSNEIDLPLNTGNPRPGAYVVKCFVKNIQKRCVFSGTVLLL
jgi:3-phytase